MAQFDVYRNPNSGTAAAFPYLLDLQSDLLSRLRSRVIAPLEPLTADPIMRRLNPIFVVEARRVVMVTADLTSVNREILRDRVASLEDHRHDIINAIDVLWAGV
jgi:toxin CcdB